MKREIAKVNHLILKIAKGDEKALEHLYELMVNYMYNVAKKYIKNPNYINVVLSTAFTKIYSNSKKFIKKDNGVNWIYTIVKNTTLDLNKTHEKVDIVELDEQIITSLSYNHESNSDLNKKIKYAVDSLPNLERTIIKLRIWEKHSLQTIAEMLKMSYSTVYRLYLEAVEKLKGLL